MRIIAPELTAYRNRKEPRCCANCFFYSEDGFCSEFDEEVPEDWANKVDWCDSWQDECPF